VWPGRHRTKNSPGDAGGKVKWVGLGGEGLLRGPLGHDAADVDEIISDHAEADPALHSGIASVAAAIETVSPDGRKLVFAQREEVLDLPSSTKRREIAPGRDIDVPIGSSAGSPQVLRRPRRRRRDRM
jgi:hypothetical protein